jgi:hypothetical protein
MQKANIFISYRRSDTAGHTGRLYDRLNNHFGGQVKIFMDLDSIAPGADFIATIEKAVGSCEALIAMIGDQWATLKDAEGKPRLQHPEDFVRAEVATALKRGILVIPVVVEGAPMPREKDLPPDLAKIVRLNALEISDSRWEHDTRRLIERLEQELGTGPSAAASSSGASRLPKLKPLAIGAAIVTLLCLALLGRWLFRSSQPGAPPQPSPAAESGKTPLPGASSGERANAVPASPAASVAASPAVINSSGSPPGAETIDVLAADNGGKLLIASKERWKATIDGKEGSYGYFYKGDFAVFAFKDERVATLGSLAVFVPGASGSNLKDFELLVGNESPEGKFESLGKFQLKNYRLVEDPFQKIELPKVKARYVKMVILSNQEGSGVAPNVYEMRLMGRLD